MKEILPGISYMPIQRPDIPPSEQSYFAQFSGEDNELYGIFIVDQRWNAEAFRKVVSAWENKEWICWTPRLKIL